VPGGINQVFSCGREKGEEEKTVAAQFFYIFLSFFSFSLSCKKKGMSLSFLSLFRIGTVFLVGFFVIA